MLVHTPTRFTSACECTHLSTAVGSMHARLGPLGGPGGGGGVGLGDRPEVPDWQLYPCVHLPMSLVLDLSQHWLWPTPEPSYVNAAQPSVAKHWVGK